MKRIVLMLTAIACLNVMAMEDDFEDQGDEVKKPKKVKKEKAPRPPKEKKAKKEKAPKAPKPKPVLEDLVIKGVVTKEEVKKGEKTSVKYVITDTEGRKIALGKAPKGVKLDDFVDSAVTVKGTGTKTEKNIKLKTIASIEKGEGAADVEVFPEEEPAEDGGEEM